MPSAHAKLSPSAADRWMQCPGSIALCESLGLKGSPPSRFSAEGTFAHEIRAKSLEARCDPREFIGDTATVDGFDFICTKEMADHLRPGVEDLLATDGTLHVEVRLDLGPWIAEGFGTSDAVVCCENTLIVNDLKFGSGVPVSAKDNRQLRIYALGALALHPTAQTIILDIDQPRTGDGTGSTARISRAELDAFGVRVRAAAMRANAPDAPLIPGDKACKWCPAKSQCPALAAQSVALFDNLDAPHVPTPQSMTPEEIAKVLAARPLVEAWLEAVHDHALIESLAGRSIPGWKAVAGRHGARSWVDGDAPITFLGAHLGDNAYTRKLVSPAQAEKLLPKAEHAVMNALCQQSEGKPALVGVDDKRAAITLATTEFDLLTSDDDPNPWE